jgi:2-polyprenyl-3-methyl-5-hydroxy-6-metoxy-1,4-benzoquinol methylase
VIGADYFPAGLIYCHKRVPSIPLFQADITSSPFPSGYFDAITCLNVLEHIEEDNKAIAHLSRLLKPGGIAFISVPAAPQLYDLYDEVHFHHRRYGLDELVERIKAADLQILNANYFGSFIYPAFYCIKRLNQFRYANLTFEQKRQLVLHEIQATKSSRTMETICRMELSIGKKVKYPFGIRIYVSAVKKAR